MSQFFVVLTSSALTPYYSYRAQEICSTSYLREKNEQSNCLWDTTTQYSHLQGQFCDSLRLLKIMIFKVFLWYLEAQFNLKLCFLMSWSHRNITKVILDQFRVTHVLSFFIKNVSQKKMPSDVGNISFLQTELNLRPEY